MLKIESATGRRSERSSIQRLIAGQLSSTLPLSDVECNSGRALRFTSSRAERAHLQPSVASSDRRPVAGPILIIYDYTT